MSDYDTVWSGRVPRFPNPQPARPERVEPQDQPNHCCRINPPYVLT